LQDCNLKDWNLKDCKGLQIDGLDNRKVLIISFSTKSILSRYHMNVKHRCLASKILRSCMVPTQNPLWVLSDKLHSTVDAALCPGHLSLMRPSLWTTCQKSRLQRILFFVRAFIVWTGLRACARRAGTEACCKSRYQILTDMP